MEKLEYKLTPEILVETLAKARTIPARNWRFSRTDGPYACGGERLVEQTIRTNLNERVDLRITYCQHFRRLLCDESCELLLEGEGYIAEHKASRNIDKEYHQIYQVYRDIRERTESLDMNEIREALKT